MSAVQNTVALGIPESRFPGPYPVGSYAEQLRRRLREFARVQLTGELWGVKPGRARVYFELRDSQGALPCSMWRDDFDRLGIALRDGMQVVVGGGCDYYPGSSSSSPSFTFAVSELRVAGEGDLLLALERLRRRLAADGVMEPQKRTVADRSPERPPLARRLVAERSAGQLAELHRHENPLARHRGQHNARVLALIDVLEAPITQSPQMRQFIERARQGGVGDADLRFN